MAVLQIIYLTINLIGVIVGLVYFCTEAESSFFSNVFTFIRKHFKGVGVIISAILFISLMLPTLAFMSAVVAFTAICGTYLN